MEKLPRQVYTSEFRQQAVELIIRDGLSIAEVSRRLSISPKTLANWGKRAKAGDLPAGEVGPRPPPPGGTGAEGGTGRARGGNARVRRGRGQFKKKAADVPPPALG